MTEPAVPPEHLPAPAPGVPGAADVPDVPAAVEDEWHRLHPLTPLIRSWQVVVVLLVVVGQNLGDQALRGESRGLPGVAVLIGLGVFVGVMLLGVGLFVVSWRFTRYRITADAIELRSGVLFRQQRRARLDRLQAVDVVQPFVARLVGLSRLKVEVAGGSGSGIALSYLREADAVSLRNHLLARAAGVTYDTQEAPEAPERTVVEVPPTRLIASLALSLPMLITTVVLVAVVVISVIVRSPAPLPTFVPILLGSVGVLWTRFTGGFGFTAAVSPDGLRLRHGLLEHRRQTVPPGRVQALRFSQPLLWRIAGWWRVQVTVAGYSDAGGEGAEDESLLLPVGPIHEARALLEIVAPGVEVDPAGLTGSGPAGDYLTSPRRARWLDPLTYTRTGVRITPGAVLIRGGRFHRFLDVVPHARTQSLAVTQGPLQRRLALASVELHSTPGPVSPVVAHLDAPRAAALLAEQSTRARQARRAAGPERWMEPQPPTPPPAVDPQPAPGAGDLP